jgi:hypothetical protein
MPFGYTGFSQAFNDLRAHTTALAVDNEEFHMFTSLMFMP